MPIKEQEVYRPPNGVTKETPVMIKTLNVHNNKRILKSGGGGARL